MNNHRTPSVYIANVALSRVGALMCLLFMPLLVGCPDLSQVQQVAKNADAAKTGITAVASDFKGTCDRQNLYVNLPPGPPPVPPPPKACVNGDDLDKLGKNLIAEQSILLAYFDALGSLSSADATGFEKAAPSLDTTFKTAGMSTTQQDMAKHAGTLASEITKMATAGFREEQIKERLAESDDAVTKLTTALADQVATDGEANPPSSSPPAFSGTSYFSLLSNEQNLLDSYYHVPLDTAKGNLVAMLVRERYQAAVDQLNARKDAAKAYRTLMLSLGKAHNKLLADSKQGNFDKAAVKKIASDLAQPISDMTNAINSLQNDMR